MNNELIYVIYGGIVLFSILSVSIVFFVIAYQRTQRAHISEKQLLQKEFQAEILETQLEISEQTMGQIAQEIHDNIGQRMTLAIQMNQQGGNTEELQPILKEVLNDLRDLSKSLSGSKINDMGLDLALEKECELIAKATKIPCSYSPPVEDLSLNQQSEIILFRCVQEILNNAIKHSKASQLNVNMKTVDGLVQLDVSDNGKGFDTNQQSEGLGLLSLQNRVQIIDGELKISSVEGSGTHVQINVPQSNNKKA
ncbi:MAG: sensor histidine kinase [Flavobacteriales bacterium]|nr:sensor histidine kinase [Flavobacteriales bacterium]